MYLRILKKDLRRKRTMNIILLIFIILAATFIASSVNNMITVSTAIDDYFGKADVPDYWFATGDEQEAERFYDFAEENGYQYNSVDLLQLNPKDILIEGKEFFYGNTVCLSTVSGSKVFDRYEKEITRVNDGEIYVTSEIFNSGENDFHEGSQITIETEGIKKVFVLKTYTKDALFGSSMIGMTRFLISENDYQLFRHENVSICKTISVYTDDSQFTDKFNNLELNLIMNVEHSAIKLMYLMDMMIAAVMLVVSVCLILISMVILRFTISFTMSEEFREIGVMKAIGIADSHIRGLYIAKYFAAAAVGAAIGFVLSFPFGDLLLEEVSKNIILSNDNKFFVNLICAAGTAVIVVGFCYFCTRKIKKFSPIDAIRNGETGERYTKKGFIHLSRSGLPCVAFMALNDILSGLRRYVSMILIFTIGILLVIIPVNTINTLRSDQLIYWFSMTQSDHIISQELLFTPGGNNEELIADKHEEIRNLLLQNHVQADIFQEIMFRMSISHNGRKASSLAFQGFGDVSADMYSYIRGSAPQNKDEVAISYIIAEKIGADIGDEVEINTGNEVNTYIVTAINQSMNNLGEGIRFYQEEELDYAYAIGSFGIQIKYTDSPDKAAIDERRRILENKYDSDTIYSSGEYISYMIGDSAGQLEGVKSLILCVVLCINVLVSVLMVKSFLTKEKREIAILKAIGFRNTSLTLWQTLRIGMVLVLSVVIGTLLATPVSRVTVEPIFRMMGAYDITFEIEPFEVYVFYQLIVLAATVFAAFLSAQGLRKISASEASNIE